MQATAFLRAGILSSRREGRSYRLRMVTNPEDMSILSSILGVTQEVRAADPYLIGFLTGS